MVVRYLIRILVLWSALLGAVASHSAELNWLAYGDLRGYLQTCGCDPRTDLGGVERLATIVGRERAAHADLVLFDLGNNFGFGPEDKLKDQFIEQGLNELKADAALVNRSELRFMAKPYRQQRNLVLSNLKERKRDARSAGLGDELIAKGKFVALGYLWHESQANRLVGWGPALKASWQKLLQGHTGKQKILLFAGPRTQLQDIASSGLFDLIVSSNDSPDHEKPSFDEHEDPSLLVRLLEPRYVRMVPLGGVGVLRGGALLKGEAKSLAEMMSSSPAAASVGGLGKLSTLPSSMAAALPGGLPQSLLQEVAVTWLSRAYEDGSPLADLLKRYETAAAAAFASRGQERLKDIAASPFAGAEACRSCHGEAHEAWSKSAHAKAYKTLEKDQKHQDGECVSCHVLGYNDKGGFVSISATPQFAGVQCETCHGPRREHANNPSVRPTTVNAREACQGCHHNPHSANFVFDEYWPKIKHGK